MREGDWLKHLLKKKILFSVASKSFKKKINGAYRQFDNYDKALKFSAADLVYLSIPNWMSSFFRLLDLYRFISEVKLRLQR